MEVLTVHHLEKSRSHRVLWLLEELSVPYQLVEYKRDPQTMLAPPELAKIHPLGKSPVVTDEGTTVAESAAILEYIAERYGNGKLVPTPGSAEWLAFRYFMHYAEGSLMPPLLVRLITEKIRTGKVPFFVRPITSKVASKIDESVSAPNIKRHVAFLEQEFAGRAWICGMEMTLADIQMSYPLEALANRAGVTAQTNPNITRILTAMRARPAYQKAIERGGPIMID